MTTDFPHLGLYKYRHSTVVSLYKGGHWEPVGRPALTRGFDGNGEEPGPSLERAVLPRPSLFNLSHKKENLNVVCSYIP